MPIAIILAIFLALFTLGSNMHRATGHPAQVVIVGGEKYNWVDKKNDTDTAVLMAPEQKDHTIYIRGGHQTGFFENIFEQVFMYRLNDNDMSETTDYITSNTQRAVLKSVNE
jgi:hypothetical protein